MRLQINYIIRCYGKKRRTLVNAVGVWQVVPLQIYAPLITNRGAVIKFAVSWLVMVRCNLVIAVTIKLGFIE